jgi:hypothetical protein
MPENLSRLSRLSRFVAAMLMLGACLNSAAEAHKLKHHRIRHSAVQQPLESAPPVYGRLVMNPAFNIACMTRDRSERALPCDQPVWVYGTPCEIDLGLGRYAPCDAVRRPRDAR